MNVKGDEIMEYIKNFLVGIVVFGAIGAVAFLLYKFANVFLAYAIIVILCAMAMYVVYGYGEAISEIIKMRKQNGR